MKGGAPQKMQCFLEVVKCLKNPRTLYSAPNLLWRLYDDGGNQQMKRSQFLEIVIAFTVSTQDGLSQEFSGAIFHYDAHYSHTLYAKWG